MAERSGRREQTRRRLLDAALRLFEERGYDQTKTAQIAAQPRGAMTLFRHFALKCRRVVDGPYDSVIAAATVSQPNDLLVLARVATAMQRRLRIAARTPSLVGE